MTKEEIEAIEELKGMSRSELDKVPYDFKKLHCQAKGCNHGTTVRDYGISPFFYSQRITGFTTWFDWSKNFYLCSKHMKFYKRLLKHFDSKHVQEKLLDLTIFPKISDLKNKLKTNKIQTQIETKCS